MTAIPVTAFVAGLLGLMLLGLVILVIRQRRRAGVVIGLGNDERLLRASRAHGNFTEFAPIFLVLMLLAELRGMGFAWLMVLGLGFVLGRAVHAMGISAVPERLWMRQLGMGLTFLAIGALSGWLLLGF